MVAVLFKRPYLAVSILFVICLLVFIALLPVPRTTKNLFSSDGIGYFSNLRSLVIDHDLNLNNEYYYLTSTTSPDPLLPKYSIGMALIWLPFYLTAHFLVTLAHTIGFPVTPDGYNQFYQFAVCLGTMFYGYIGLLLILKLCREFFDAFIALTALILIWFGWNIVYYLVIENSMSHIPSMAVVAGLLAWWRFYPKTRSFFYWSGLGILAGLAAMIRPQDTAFVLLPGLDLAGQLISAIRNRPWKWAAFLKIGQQSLITGLSFLLCYTPQLAASQIAYGNPLANGYAVQGETFDLTSPHLFEIFFSTWHGLFTWHPLILLATIGLFFLGQRNRVYALKLGLMLAIQAYIVSCWHVWWQGDAFGSRMLINCAPILTLGLAALLEYLYKRWDFKALWIIGVSALLWNFLFIIQYRLGFIPKGEALTWQQLILDKLTVIYDIVKKKK
jgi:hypothetical protein